MGAIRAEEEPRVPRTVPEGGLEDQRVAVAVHTLVAVPLEGEGAVHEELYPVDPLVEARHDIPGVRDEVRPILEAYAPARQPSLKRLRAREYPDSLALDEAVPGLGPYGQALASEVALGDRAGRHPEFLDLGAPLALVGLRVPQVEELRGAVDVVVVQMGERDDVEPVTPGFFEFLPERRRQVHLETSLDVLVGKVEEQQTAALGLDKAGIRVALRIKSNLVRHGGIFLPFVHKTM